MFAKYKKEREGVDIIKTDKGFISYKIIFPSCLIQDWYVLPEFREHGHGYFLADQVFELCKQSGVKTIFCQTDDRANGVQLAKDAIKNFGFEILKKDKYVTDYSMEVSQWEAF